MSLKKLPRTDLWHQPLLRDYLGRLRDLAEAGPVASLTGHAGHGYTLHSFKSSDIQLDVPGARHDLCEVTKTLSSHPHMNLVAGAASGKTITCKALISRMCSAMSNQKESALGDRLPIFIECRTAEFYATETLADHVIRSVTPLLKKPSEEAFALIREFIAEGEYSLLIDDVDLLKGHDLEIAMSYVESSVELAASVLATSVRPLSEITKSPLALGRITTFSRVDSLLLVQQWLDMYRTPKEDAKACLAAFGNCPWDLQGFLAEPHSLRLIYDVYCFTKALPENGHELFEQALTFCSLRVAPKTPGLTRADQRRLWDAVGYHLWSRTDGNPYISEAEYQEVVRKNCLALTFSEAEASRIAENCLTRTLENCGLFQQNSSGVKFAFHSMMEACAVRYLAYQMVSPDFLAKKRRTAKLHDAIQSMLQDDNHRSGVLKAIDLILYKDGQEWFDAISDCIGLFRPLKFA